MHSVLLFHAVTDARWFDDVISALLRQVRLVPFEELRDGANPSGSVVSSCHITVDDGDRSFYETIYPVLRMRRVPATLFVSPKICVQRLNFWFQTIDGHSDELLRQVAAQVLGVSAERLAGYRPTSLFKAMPAYQMKEALKLLKRTTRVDFEPCRNMSVKELREVYSSGWVAPGAHTMNHAILAHEDDESCRHEIVASVHELSEMLDQPVTLFAYPNGIADFDFGSREEGILAAHGVRSAFATDVAHAKAPLNRLRIPRVAISDREPIAMVAAKLLLGTQWNRLRSFLGRGEFFERRRLNEVLRSQRSLHLLPEAGVMNS